MNKVSYLLFTLLIAPLTLNASYYKCYIDKNYSLDGKGGVRESEIFTSRDFTIDRKSGEYRLGGKTLGFLNIDQQGDKEWTFKASFLKKTDAGDFRTLILNVQEFKESDKKPFMLFDDLFLGVKTGFCDNF